MYPVLCSILHALLSCYNPSSLSELEKERKSCKDSRMLVASLSFFITNIIDEYHLRRMDIDSLQDGHNAVSDMKAASSSSPSAPSSSFNALRELAIRLYHARQEGGNDLDDTILSSALQHFATARQMARKLAMENKHDREEVARKRSNMDAAYLAQQNRNYEIGYLYREIEKCNDYEWV